MYVKPPSSNPSRIKLPDNYGGSAFSSSIYSDMPPPVRRPSYQRDDRTSAEVSRSSDIPHKSSPLASQMLDPRSEPDIPTTVDEYTDRHYNVNTPIQEPPSDAYRDVSEEHAPFNNQKSQSLLSSLIPSVSPSKNFPFGHGLGGEELLILGVMLLIFLSGSETGEMDSEFIILLGLLLFAG